MISLHIICDNANPEALDRALLYLVRTKATVVNIAGGAALDTAMHYVDRVRSAVPGIKILFRCLDPEDTGIWTKMNPQQWFDSRVTPRLDWCKRNDIVYVTDNESSGDDDTIRRYCAWQIEVMALLHKVGLHAAVGRFATGNIQEHQYALLKPMFDAMAVGDYFSSNEYLNAPGKSSGGHVFRYDLAWKAAGRELPTVIGEYGIAADYDAGRGYRTLGMSGKDYVAYLISFYKEWYAPHGVTVCVYCVGGFNQWDSFKLDDSVFEALEGFAGTQSKPPAVIIPITPPRPVEPPKTPKITEPDNQPIHGTIPQIDPPNVIDLPPVVQSHTYEVKISAINPTGDLMARYLEKMFEYSRVLFDEFVKDELVKSPVRFEYKEVK